MHRESHQVPRPPRAREVYDPAPILDPPLRGMPEWPGPPLDAEPEPFEVQSRDPFGELPARALETAREDDRVLEHLSERRHAWLGAGVLENKEGEGRSVVVVIFDYERNVAVEVGLEEADGGLRVVSVDDVAYHPAPSDEEIRRATEMARGDRRVVAQLSDELESTAILVSDVEQGDRHHGARRIEIGFGRADERLPRIRALVDLTEERVVGVHADDRHADEYREDPS
ncbi:MAG: hypothetical protein ACJ768_03355 [Gaiellaceae bacterium]